MAHCNGVGGPRRGQRRYTEAASATVPRDGVAESGRSRHVARGYDSGLPLPLPLPLTLTTVPVAAHCPCPCSRGDPGSFSVGCRFVSNL